MNTDMLRDLPEKMVLDALYAGFEEAIFILDRNRSIRYANGVALSWLQEEYPDLSEKVLDLSFEKVGDLPALFDLNSRKVKPLAKAEQQTILLELHDQHDKRLVSVRTQKLPWGEENYMVSMRDILERWRKEQTQKALYQVSEAVATADDLHTFLKRIHEIIASLIPARNFYIALYDSNTQYISFPYYVDEQDYLTPQQQKLRTRDRKVKRGLTEYLLHVGEALLVTGEMMESLTEQEVISVVGSIPLEWLGVPLKNAQAETIGGLVVQTYTPGVRYTEADKALLNFVSTQLAMAIERKQFEDRLKQERELFVSGPVVVFKLLVEDRKNATMLYVSPNVKQFGYSPEEFTGGSRYYKEIIHPDDQDNVFDYKDLAFQDNQTFMGEEYRILTVEGEARWVYDFTVIRRHPNQALVEYNFYILDITARKDAEAGLQRANENLEKRVIERTAKVQETQDFLQLLIDTIPVPVYYKDKNGVYTGCNTAYENFTGLVRGDLIGKTTNQVWPADQSKTFESADYTLFEQPGKQNFEAAVRSQDGQNHDVVFYKATFDNEKEQPAGLVGVMLDITERKRFEKLQETLYLISEAASSTRDLEALFAFVHNVVNQLIPAKNFYLAMYDPEEDLVTFPYFLDETSEVPPPPRKAGNGLTEYGLRLGEAVLLTRKQIDALTENEDVQPSGNLPEQWMGVPLRTENDRIIGLLVVQSYDAREISYNLDHQELLEFVSTQIALAIERKRTQEALRLLNQELEGKVYERTQQLNRQLAELRQRERELTAVVDTAQALRQTHKPEEIYEIILRSMMDALDASGVSLAVLEHDTQELVYAKSFGDFSVQSGVRLPVGSGAAGWVVRSGKFYLNNNVQKDPGPTLLELTGGVRSILIVPMIVDDQVIGMLEAGNERPWNEEDIRILVAMAEIAAYAIQREMLSEQKERQLQRLNVLREIDRMITGNFDLYNIMKFLLGQIANQLEIDAADILLTNEGTAVFEFGSGHGFYTPNNRESLVAVQQGPAEWVLISGETVSIPQIARSRQWSAFFNQIRNENFNSYFAVPLKAKGQILGVLELFKRSTLKPDQEWEDFLHALAQQTAIAIENAQLLDKMQKANREMLFAYDRTIEGWAQALELRDSETGGHSRMVMEWTIMLAQAMGIRKADELTHIRRGALLHDIGKMGIPDSILLKEGPLNDEEWQEMRRHPQYAWDLLHPIKFLQPALDIPVYHHERWDGSGYPHGLKGQEIPLPARIFSVIDVYHALTSDRPYRPAWTHEKTVNYIRDNAGKQFDPAVVDQFIILVEQWTPKNLHSE